MEAHSQATYTNKQVGARGSPARGVERLGHSGYLTKSSNLLKATMAPIRWHSGEKPLSMKSSVLCLSRSGLVTLMGAAILRGDRKRGMKQLLEDLAPRAVPVRKLRRARLAREPAHSRTEDCGWKGWGLGLRSLVWLLRTWYSLRAPQANDEWMNDMHAHKSSLNVVPGQAQIVDSATEKEHT